MIPQGRLSTTLVEGAYLPAEHIPFQALTSYEMGPLAIEDTSEGLIYQAWKVTYNRTTGDVTLIPTITGVPVVVLTVLDIKYITFTFDQNARVTITYTTSTSSYMYWYDTDIASTVTTDLGTDVITPSISLDDKRVTQSAVNDMLLWYTKEEIGGTYELFMLRQRDRFLTEYSMATGVPYSRLANIGMTDELRVQLTVRNY